MIWVPVCAQRACNGAKLVQTVPSAVHSTRACGAWCARCSWRAVHFLGPALPPWVHASGGARSQSIPNGIITVYVSRGAAKTRLIILELGSR